MTCNLANIGDKTTERKYNIKTVEVLESWKQVVLWSFLEKCYVENLTYINSVSKYMIGFSLFLTDWNVKHGKPQKSIFDVAVSSDERKPRDVPHKAFFVNFGTKYWTIFWEEISTKTAGIKYWLTGPGTSFRWRLRSGRPKTPPFKHIWNDSGIPISLLFKFQVRVRANISRQLLWRIIKTQFLLGHAELLVRKDN